MDLDDAAFETRVDGVVREIGERGKPCVKQRSAAASAAAVPEAVPPAIPAPAPAPEPISPPSARTPMVAAPGRLDLADISSAHHVSASSSPALMTNASDVIGSSGSGGILSFAELSQFVYKQQQLMAEREAQQEAKAEKYIQALKVEMERDRQEAKTTQADMAAQIEALRDELNRAKETLAHPLAQVLSDSQIAALQARVQALHDAKLLTDEETFNLEDTVADCVEVMASGARFVAHTVVSQVVKMVALNERIEADAAFARQLRRKCC